MPLDIDPPVNLPDLVLCCILRFVAWRLYRTDHHALAAFAMTCRAARRHSQHLLDRLVYLTTPLSVRRFAEHISHTPASSRPVMLVSILIDIHTSQFNIAEDIEAILDHCRSETIELSVSLLQAFASSSLCGARTVFLTRAGSSLLCDFVALGYQRHIERLVVDYGHQSQLSDALVFLPALTHMAIVLTERVPIDDLRERLENITRYRHVHLVVIGDAASLGSIETFAHQNPMQSFRTVVFRPPGTDMSFRIPDVHESLYARFALGDIDIWGTLDTV
ncbi:hypothetical protein AURDEDRAFT_175504 [Auricularia subglabra TFB-10046 SS5]|uniref:Uncharacterized protein n=1 Tax=Auricularia subglabra (strain TFB-10046 / SS5) TaxID=717982 RepID=J0CXE1_AURST|nr:hypothetical protein AURDEDRAFT_175504 [Auricularia subglabra TFB-10046 SS5]